MKIDRSFAHLHFGNVWRTFVRLGRIMIKIPLRSLLQNRNLVQHVITHLVFEMNDLVIHTYQFIRLYVITCHANQTDLPVVDEPFILYCLKVLGTRDNRGRAMANVGLLERLETFYNVEYQPLLHHEKTDLRNKTFLLPYLATQISRRQLVPFFSTISILNISTKASTWIRG